MSGFELGVVAALVLLVGLAVAILVAVRGGGEAAALRAQVGDLKAALEAIRGDAGAHARAAREELGAGMDRLGAALSATTGERLDGLAKSVSNGRIESENHANALRTVLLGQFDTLAKSVGDRMATHGAAHADTLAGFGTALGAHREAAAGEADRLREGVTATLTALGKRLDDALAAADQRQAEALDGAAKRQAAATGELTGKVKEMVEANERRGDGLRQTVEGRLDAIRQENGAKLDEMRATVDEKLQGTLNERLGASFSMVNENLERVHKSVGEMQQIATGVGDLKRVLSNVKTRGTYGETNLGLLLEQVMAPEQYAAQVVVKPGDKARVDFAIRLPGDGDEPIWLPIDAKLPSEDYERLVEAADRADASAIEQSAKALADRIRLFAKDIGGKYIHPPHTTDFAIMFLPTEGLFAEVVRRPGLVDALHRECKVVVAGPTTLLALLSSLRMGFRTLAVQKRSSEVWQVLGAVKSEFGKFGGLIDSASKQLGTVQNTLESVRKKTNTVNSKLRSVEALPDAAAQATLAIAAEDLASELEAAE